MRKSITLLALFVASVTFAQKADYGQLLEADFRGYTPNIVGEDEENLYAMDYRGDEVYIEAFDKQNLRSNYCKAVELPDDWGVHEQLERLSFINGEFVYFVSLFHRKADRFELIAQTIDPKSGRLKDRKKLFSTQVERNRDRGFYDVMVSKNRTSILVRTASYYKELDRTIEHLVLLDKNFEQVLDKEYSTEGEYLAVSSNLMVDDEGSIYFLQKGDIVILDAFADFEEWREPIPLDEVESGSQLKNVYTTFNPKQDLVIVGSYITEDAEDTDENKANEDTKEGDTQVEGMFYLRLDGLNKEVAAVKLSKFDQDYVNQYRTEDDLEDGLDTEVNDEFSSFRFFFRKDNSLVLVGEAIDSRSYYSNGRKIGEVNNYNDLAVYHFDENGTMKWAERVPKRQRFYYNSILLGFHTGSFGLSWLTVPFETREYFSYTGYFDDGKFCLLYNDDDENIATNYQNKEVECMKRFKSSMPVAYTLDMETGRKKRKAVPGLVRDEKMWIKPKLTYQKDAENPVYFFISYKKDYRLGKLKASDQQI